MFRSQRIYAYLLI